MKVEREPVVAGVGTKREREREDRQRAEQQPLGAADRHGLHAAGSAERRLGCE